MSLLYSLVAISQIFIITSVLQYMVQKRKKYLVLVSSNIDLTLFLQIAQYCLLNWCCIHLLFIRNCPIHLEITNNEYNINLV